ncbi:MAG: ATP-binding protein [Acidimicrobiia bacterium]
MAALARSSLDASVDEVLEQLSTVLGSPTVAMYMWSHGSGGLELQRSLSGGRHLPAFIPAPAGVDLDEPTCLDLLPVGESLRLAPICSDVGVVGALAYRHDCSWSPTASLISSSFVRVIDLLVQRRLFSAMQQQLQYRSSRDDYFISLAALASLAADMEFVVIRERDGRDLRCIAYEGFEGISAAALDVSIGKVPLLRDVFEQRRSVAVRSLSEGSSNVVGDLSELRGLEDVEGFVIVPLVQGNEVVGTVGFGSRYRGSFSVERIAGLEGLAQAIGVLISNFHHFHQTLDDLSDLSKVAVSITALEVAQSARHEAKAIVGNMLGQLTILQQHVNQRDTRSALFDIDSLKDQTNRISVSIDKIKSATQPPRQLLQLVNIEDVWEEARDQVISRLNDLKIRTTYIGPARTVEAYREWLRHVLLNLLLNSMDAFDTRGRKGDRRIRLRIREESSTDSVLVLRYEDTAGGIRKEDFAAVDNPDDLPLEQLIFEPGATTKPEGSGWGLFLVREILQRHGGSIDAVSLRGAGGVVFDLRLPVKQEA